MSAIAPLSTRTDTARYPVVMPVSKGRKKANKRPTPPSHKPTALDDKGPSPTWYVVIMFGLMTLGVVIILLNYLGVLPGGTANRYLITGLVGIGVGFSMTMNYR
jgi:hypothetical protein